MKRVMALALLLMVVVLVLSAPMAEAKKKRHHHKRHHTPAPALPPDQAVNGIGQFKGDCFWVNNSYADPIVKPSSDMHHLHNFFGNRRVTSDSTFEPFMTQQSTCDGPANKSVYWVLQVYVDGISLRPKRTGVYYSSKGGLDPLKTENTPLGVKVIAKYPYIAPSAQEAAEVDWYCSSGNSPNKIPDGINQQPPASAACNETNDPNRTLGVTVNVPECLDPTTLSAHQHRVVRAPGRPAQPLSPSARGPAVAQMGTSKYPRCKCSWTTRYSPVRTTPAPTA
jgi:hypothetical protein